MSSLDFLGFHVDSEGVKPLPERVKAFQDHPRPTTIKQLQGVLGVFNYYRRFVPRGAQILHPLFEALRGKPKKLLWTPQCEKAFINAKTASRTQPY